MVKLLRQTSTAISDAVLALVCFFWVTQIPSFALFVSQGVDTLAQQLGLAIIGLAAAAGSIKFADVAFTQQARRAHEFLTPLGKFVGTPLLVIPATSPGVLAMIPVPGALMQLAAVAGGLSAAFFALRSNRQFQKAVPLVFVVASGAYGLYTMRQLTIAAFGLFGAAGAILDSHRNLGVPGVRNVDWFHYLLAAGVSCYVATVHLPF